MTYIILILVYLLSFYLSWRWNHIAFSSGGYLEYEKEEKIGLSFFFCIFPFVNTLYFIIAYSISFTAKEHPDNEKFDNFLDKFFKIK